MTGLGQRIDAYCERTDFAFWAEPVNALTNLAFVAAAAACLVALTRAGRRDGGIVLLIALVAAIGVGSFLFHTIATRWAGLADVIPIQLFILAYLALAMRRFFGRGWPAAIAIAAAFIPAAMALRWVIGGLGLGGLGATTGYLAAATALAVTAALLGRRGHPAAAPLAGATVLFLVSLTFRSLDEPLCPVWPLGTHFLWHILNGVLLGWLVLTMLRFGRPPPAAG